jgi:hypothetical protein
LRRLSPQAAILLLVAVVAWLVMVGRAGAGVPAFLLTALVDRLVGDHPAWATAMVGLAAIVLAEKLWAHGELLARAVGVAALALAVTVIWVPTLAPGLHQTSTMMGMAGS